MFSIKISRRRLFGAAALASGILITAAVLLYGLSVRAQTTTIPLGTYTALVTETTSSPLSRIGEYKVMFLDGGKFLMFANELTVANGTYVVVGDRVEFTLPWGTGACATKGVYQWSLTGNKLTLAVAPGQTDSCARRPGTALTFFKTDPAESFWKNVGPEGGTISSLLSYDGKLFAGTQDPNNGSGQQFSAGGPGIFVSADNGQSWKVTRGFRGFSIYALAAFNGVLFAGADESTILLSLDGGQTWEINNGNLIGAAPFTVTGFAVSNGKLYASARGLGVLRMTDNPYLWEKAGTGGLTNLNLTSLAAIGANLFVSTDGGGVLVSTDGNNWTPVNNGLVNQRIYTLAVGGNTLYAGTALGSPASMPNEVYFSNDNGQNWQRVGNGLTASFPAGFLNAVYKLAPASGKLFAASSNGVIVNEGGNWRSVLQGSPFPPFYSIVASDNQIFAGAFYDGVSRSLDGGATWSTTNNGLTARMTNAVLKDNDVLYAGVSSGAFISTNEGQTWTRTDLPTIAVRNFLAFNGKVFAGTINGVYVTANPGQTWTRASNGLAAGTVTRIVAVGNVLYAAVYNGGVFRSIDSGQNWAAVNNGLVTLQINDLVARGSTLFVCADNAGVMRSANEGQNWSVVNNGLPAGRIFSLAVSGNNLLAAVFGQVIYRSADNGETWTKSANGVAPPGIFTLYASGATVYASGEPTLGALRSTDSGQSWSFVNAGFAPRYTYGFFASGSTLYAATTHGVCISNNLVNSLATVSAASYSASAIADKAIVAAFGVDLALSTEVAASLPLPTTLAGTTVKVRDSNGVERLAPLFFVSGGQVNYQIPAGTAAGTATVTITNGNGVGAINTVEIRASAPSVFSANSSGSGPAAAVDAITGAAAPFNATMANGQPNIIAVFGTGLGGDATDVDGNVNASVTARIDGNAVTLLYAGRAPGFAGLNQFNVVLPAGVTSGSHALTFTRGGATSNTTTLLIR